MFEYIGNLVGLGFHAVASGMFQSSTFGFAGILPQKYTAAVMAGQVSKTDLSLVC